MQVQSSPTPATHQVSPFNRRVAMSRSHLSRSSQTPTSASKFGRNLSSSSRTPRNKDIVRRVLSNRKAPNSTSTRRSIRVTNPTTPHSARKLDLESSSTFSSHPHTITESIAVETPTADADDDSSVLPAPVPDKHTAPRQHQSPFEKLMADALSRGPGRAKAFTALEEMAKGGVLEAAVEPYTWDKFVDMYRKAFGEQSKEVIMIPHHLDNFSHPR